LPGFTLPLVAATRVASTCSGGPRME
jgi:hypothetical protein